MVQVLPHVPGFGERLIDQISEVGGKVAENYSREKAQTALQKLLNGAGTPEITQQNGTDQTSAPQANSQSMPQAGTQSPQQARSLSPMNLLAINQAATKAYGAEGAKILTDNLVKEQVELRKFNLEQRGLAEKQKIEEDKKQKDLQSSDQILKDLEELKEYAGGWFGTKTFGGSFRRDAVEKKQEIDSEAIALEGFFRDLATKGTLPTKTFETLLSKIPSSDMSERQYQGSINGIRKILKAHGLNLDEAAKVKPGTPITPEIVDTFLKESNGDPAKAREKAKKMGYSF